MESLKQIYPLALRYDDDDQISPFLEELQTHFSKKYGAIKISYMLIDKRRDIGYFAKYRIDSATANLINNAGITRFLRTYEQRLTDKSHTGSIVPQVFNKYKHKTPDLTDSSFEPQNLKEYFERYSKEYQNETIDFQIIGPLYNAKNFALAEYALVKALLGSCCYDSSYFWAMPIFVFGRLQGMIYCLYDQKQVINESFYEEKEQHVQKINEAFRQHIIK